MWRPGFVRRSCFGVVPSVRALVVAKRIAKRGNQKGSTRAAPPSRILFDGPHDDHIPSKCEVSDDLGPPCAGRQRPAEPRVWDPKCKSCQSGQFSPERTRRAKCVYVEPVAPHAACLMTSVPTCTADVGNPIVEVPTFPSGPQGIVDRVQEHMPSRQLGGRQPALRQRRPELVEAAHAWPNPPKMSKTTANHRHRTSNRYCNTLAREAWDVRARAPGRSTHGTG